MALHKPDFMLVGAPKSGTASLCDWLDQHPEIHVMRPREPNFFGSDLKMERHYSSLSAYLQEFRDHDRFCCGEGTTWYLYSESAPEEINRHNPNMLILMILRNPVDVVHSLHSYRRYYGNEDEEDLNKVLDREEELLEQWQKRGEPKDVMRIYLDVARYSLGVERYLARFGEQRVKILFFEDLKSRPADLLQEIFNFLGVSPMFEPNLSIKNESGIYKSRILKNLILNPGGTVKMISRWFPQPIRLKVGRLIRRANTTYGVKPSFPPVVRERIVEALTPDVIRLENLLNLQRPEWRQ